MGTPRLPSPPPLPAPVWCDPSVLYQCAVIVVITVRNTQETNGKSNSRYRRGGGRSGSREVDPEFDLGEVCR